MQNKTFQPIILSLIALRCTTQHYYLGFAPFGFTGLMEEDGGRRVVVGTIGMFGLSYLSPNEIGIHVLNRKKTAIYRHAL